MSSYLLRLTQSPDFIYKSYLCHCKHKYISIDLFMFIQTYKNWLAAESVGKKACDSMLKP